MKNNDPDREEDYVNSQHVFTLIHNTEDPCKIKMYFDHKEIHSADCCGSQNSVSFFSGVGSEFLGGHFEFGPDNETAYGALQKGQHKEEAILQLKPPEFNVALSKDAGAYVEAESNRLKLHWDVNSDKWKGAHWSDKEMEYSYSIKPGPPIGGQKVYIFAADFTDNETGVMWDVDNNPNNYDGFADITISSEGQVSFSKNLADKPLDPDRKSKEFPSIFPDDMVYDMNELGTIFNGAMSIGSTVEDAVVYAMHATPKNPLILGEYMLCCDSRPKSTFAVSNGKLLLNNVKIQSSGVVNNTLWWRDLSKEHSQSSGLPHTGQLEFSKDGNTGVIFRKSKTEQLITARPRQLKSSTPADLNIYSLIAMDPNAKSKDGTTDVVQGDSMQDFYKTIQYYMDDSLRKDFISLNPPDMSGITNIASDNPDVNSKFYGFISIPYLVNALANSTQSGSNQLNAVRAAKMLNKGFLYDNSFKDVYKDQTQKYYTLCFEKYYPLMSEYLMDQNVNSAKYSKIIQSDSQQWIDSFKPVEKETEEDKRARVDSIAIIQNLANRAIQQNLYWAYELFRFATSNYFLTWLQAQLLNPNGSSQTLSLTIKKYVTLMQVLDPSGDFSFQYLNYIKQYQFMSILPQLLNLQDLSEDFNIIMKKILQSFIDTYINSSDPKMAEAARELQKQIRLNNLEPFLDAFSVVLQQNPGGSWLNLVERFQGKIVKKLGKAALQVANLFLVGVSSISIIFVITGTIKWADMSAVDQASFIVMSFSLFQKLALGIVTRVIKARAAFVASGGSWMDSMSTFFRGKWRFPNKPGEYLENGFAKWLVDTKGPGRQAGGAAMVAAEGAEGLLEAERNMTKMERAFGKNLGEFIATRLAAVFATINIVLSAIQLSESKTGIEKAMNSLFLVSGILELISVIGTWVIGAESVAAGSTLATVFGLASVLGIIAAVAGAIILIIILATHKDPPTPLENFVNNQAAKAGYKMEKGVDIDYFQVNKINNQSNTVGISISEDSDVKNCIRVLPDKTFDLSTLSYGTDTVWEIATDEFGYAKFATFVYSSKQEPSGVFIKLKNGHVVAEGAIADENEDCYKWICEITGDPNYKKDSITIGSNTIIQKFLQSASFSIKNVASDKKKVNDYLNVGNGKLMVNTQPKEWVLSMQGMKPARLTMQDFKLTQYNHNAQAFPRLLQPGSDYDKKWIVTPNLPDFLEINGKTGTISQKSDTVNFNGSFTLTVTNHYGSTDTTFKIEATTH